MDRSFGGHCSPQVRCTEGGWADVASGELGVSGCPACVWTQGVCHAWDTRCGPARPSVGLSCNQELRPQLSWSQTELQKHLVRQVTLGPGLGLSARDREQEAGCTCPWAIQALPCPSPASRSGTFSPKSPPAGDFHLRGCKADVRPCQGHCGLSDGELWASCPP